MRAGSVAVSLNAPATWAPRVVSAASEEVRSARAAAVSAVLSGVVSRLVRRVSRARRTGARVAAVARDWERASRTAGSAKWAARARTSSSPSGRVSSGVRRARPMAASLPPRARVARMRFSSGSARPSGEARSAAVAVGFSSMAQRAR